MAGHVAPEAAVGGPIALLREGDSVRIDIAERRIDIDLAEEELARRRAAWTPPPPKYKTGVFAKYIALVSSSAEGATTCPAL
jgi:dihydroxy-acid dehydratase